VFSPPSVPVWAGGICRVGRLSLLEAVLHTGVSLLSNVLSNVLSYGYSLSLSPNDYDRYL
jgi:hypothetical protein